MESVNFCYWLQGLFELQGDTLRTLDERQVDLIKRHLAMVFVHEIDPSYPNGEKLNELHSPLMPPPLPTGKMTAISKSNGSEIQLSARPAPNRPRC